jgi:DHA1 family inner membrane transport protein
VLAALGVAALLTPLSTFALSPFLPAIATDLGTRVGLLGQIPAASMLLAAVLGLVVGPVADHFGHRRALLIGVVAVLGGSVTIALAPSYLLLLPAALFWALGRGTTMPMAMAVAGSRFAGAARRKAISRVVVASAVAIIVGLPLLTQVGAALGWRVVFAVLAAVALATALLLLWLLPADGPPPPTPLRPGTALRAYGPLLRSGPMRGLYGGALLRNGELWLVQTYQGAFLIQTHGLGAAEVGLVFAAMGAGEVFGCVLAGGRLGGAPARQLMTGLHILSGALLGAALVLPLPAAAVIAMIALAALMTGLGDVIEPALLLRETPVGQATTTTLLGSVQSVGAALGSGLGGLALLLGGYQALGLGAIAGGLIAAALVWQALPGPTTQPAPRAVG